jgi:DNA-directed RNA polymerase subunit RPC12/RpoP
MDVICPCNNCSENLEFEESAAGETVKCPHCGVDTVLFIPPVPVDSPPSEPESVPEPKPQKAKLVAHEQKKPTYKGGVEESLEIAGATFWALGVAGGAGGLLVALMLFFFEQPMWAGACCIIAVVAFVQGALINTVCKAGGEIIRLLKKSNGLKYSGGISQPTMQLDGVVSYTCAACGASVVPRAQTKCAKCGVEFER